MTSLEWYELFMAKTSGLMKSRNMTAEDLAAAIGADVKTVEKWVGGYKIPNGPGIVRIAKALGVEVKTLIDFEN